MSFNRYLGILLISALSFSCSDYLRGQRKDPDVIEMTDSRFQCLKKLPDTLEDLSKAEGNEQDIQISFSCLEDALIYFKERTQGSADGDYTAQDFRRFFGKYFLKQNNISETLAVELVRLKAALLGGHVDVVSKAEVVKLSRLIKTLREEIVQLLPYLKTLMTRKDTAVTQEISEATTALRKSSARILRGTEFYKSKYTFENAEKLIQEIFNFIETRKESGMAERVRQYWPLVEKFKLVLLGERSGLNDLRDWEEALGSFVDLYDLGLRTHYLLKGRDLGSPDTVYELGLFMEKTLLMVEHSPQLKRRGFIPVEHIDSLIDVLIDNGFIKFNLTRATIKESYRMFFGKLVGRQNFHRANDFVSFDRNHLHALTKEFRVWFALQNWVNAVVKESSSVLSWNTIKTHAKEFEFDEIARRLFPLADRTEIDELRQAWRDFNVILSRPNPTTFNSHGRYNLVFEATTYPNTWGSLSRSNVMYLLTRLMFRGYGEHFLEFQEAVLLEPQLVRWYDDFKPLGLELKAFDPLHTNSGKRSFKEANFFTPSGDGNKAITFHELNEYVSILVSAGLGSVGSSREIAEGEECATGNIDVFELPTFREDCFKEALWKNRQQLFDNMPVLLRFFDAHPKEWDLFYENLMDAARVDRAPPGEVEHGDIRTFIMMTHYLESLMIRYDRNKDGYLEVSEIEQATPRFMTFLKDITEIPWYAEFADEFLLKHGFIYLVTEGHRPQGKDWLNYVEKRAKDKLFGRTAKVSRAGLAQVFKNLKDELKKN